MKRRSYVPFIVTSAVLFVIGLALGAGKSDQDTSAANTASKVLLAVGLLALLVTAILEVVSRRRTRRATSTAREVPLR
jgi:Sec-independent protein secretion pathway component TatC